MNNKRLYVDFHVLQTVPPSCINRDDTGTPKTCVYGGTTRARVSSQAWKHAMRQMFREELLEECELGYRTKQIVSLVAKEIRQTDMSIDDEAARKMAKTSLENAGLKIKDKKEKEEGTGALFFISSSQVKGLANLAIKKCKDNKEYKKVMAEAPSVDMAMFGRMVADDTSLNQDAAVQVAHSISTHAIQNEYDYFTAMDDCQTEDQAGAGHLGTVEFNSSTLYRYATVNVKELAKSLGARQATRAIRAFAEAFIRSMPTGKQNTFANRTLPDAVYIAVRCDQPVNLCGAFEKAIPAGEDGYIRRSEKELAKYAQRVYDNFAEEPIMSFAVGEELSALFGKSAESGKLNYILDKIEETLQKLSKDGDA